MKLDLSGKVALVTGGSRGIGRALALGLAEAGATVAIHYRTQPKEAEAIADTIRQAGGQAAIFAADMADPLAPADLIQRVIAAWGRLDILVNNAAEMSDAPVETLPDAMWMQTIQVNLNAVFRCCQAVIPGMKARGWGRIINITSQAAYTGSANHAHYAAAKAGLNGLTYSLAKEVATSGITVNLVAPGRILTEMVTSRMSGREAEWLAQIPMRRFGSAEEIAPAVVFLASDAAAYMTGTTLHINGGMLMS